MVIQSKTIASEMPLAHPLDGIKAKIQRAEESTQTFKTEISAYLTSDPRPYTVVGNLQDDHLKYVFKAYSNIAPPLRFSVVAGEIVHHLRSSLDHLVVALAQRNGQRPLNNHMFPVCRTREKFIKACNGGNIKGVSKRAFRRIVRAQPYHQATPDIYTLSAIHDLNIRDKHRLLLVVIAAAQIGQNIRVGTAKAEGPPVEIIGLGDPAPRKVSEEGVEVFSVSLGNPAPDFYANADFVGHIAFEQVGSAEIVPVIPALTKMAQFTRHLVGQFAFEF